MSPPSKPNAEQISDSEDWTKLTDLNERRKVQNRLAQRSRRKKLKMLEGREGTSKRTVSQTSKSPEPIPEHTKSTEWPESLRDIKSLLSQIDQTKTRLQEYLSSISIAVQEAPVPVATTWESWSFPNMDDENLNALFQGIERYEPDPGPIPLSATNHLKTDGTGDIAVSEDVAVIKAPMASPLLTPPASVSSRSPFCGTNSSLQQNLYTIGTTNDVCSVEVSDHGNTALHIAARNRHHSIIRLLVETGTDINSQNDQQMTALQIAISSANTNTAQFLLELGADTTCTTSSGETVLHLAARNGDVAMVELLLQRYVSINVRNHCGETALHAAVTAGHEEVVRVMLAHGVDPQAKVGVQTPVLDSTFDWNMIMEF
ncbi:hypothetical protein QM012_002947 [Aureobasidium pullulans]|uniref:BZIP domain-containing protein n=1 Tax=Aureobasidium pullulans TaxID=5580 RepID=A0ABR0TC82_AURPU